MSSTLDRRSFLTHSAATIGGVAMAGSVVDGLLANVAGAAVGVAKGKPKLGGVLTVGTLSDVPNYHIFNGPSGKFDDSGFCVANALYDPLFVMSADGKSVLPMLAVSAKPSADLHGMDHCAASRVCSFTTAQTLMPPSSWPTTTPPAGERQRSVPPFSPSSPQ